LETIEPRLRAAESGDWSPALGWYHAGEKAGFIGAIVGAVLILLVWGFIARRRGA
jgi:LPXTG-motif cell wall-anchored protein